MCNDCRTQDVTAIADALKAIAEIDVRYPSRLPARASAIGSIRRAARHLETYSAGLEGSNRRLREENKQLEQQLAAAQNTVNERVWQLAAMKDDRDYHQRQRKQAENEVYFLRLMNEIIRLMPGIELGHYAKGGTTGSFGISGIPDIRLVVDIDNQTQEITNTVTGRRTISKLSHSRLTAEAATAIEAMIPSVTLTPDNTLRRLWADLFVNKAGAQPASVPSDKLARSIGPSALEATVQIGDAYVPDGPDYNDRRGSLRTNPDYDPCL